MVELQGAGLSDAGCDLLAMLHQTGPVGSGLLSLIAVGGADDLPRR